MKQVNYKKELLKLLEDLSKTYPTFGIGRHISTALSEYGDFWGITDKEFLFALEKYQTQLSIDNGDFTSSDYLDKIIEDGKHLFDIKPFEEEDDF